MPLWRLKFQKKLTDSTSLWLQMGLKMAYIHGYFNRENDDHPVDVRVPILSGPPFPQLRHCEPPTFTRFTCRRIRRKHVILIVITLW